MPFHTGLIGKYDKRYYEIYRDPTPADCQLLAEQTEHPHKLRLLLTEEGELYAFTIELLHDLATAELGKEGISIVCFFDENKIEAADVGNLDLEDLARAIQAAADSFLMMGIQPDTRVRIIIHQGLWGDQTFPFQEIIEGSWENISQRANFDV